MAGYYDLVLGLIPLALIGLTTGLAQTSLSLTQAVPVAAAVAAGIIAHALFVRAPVTVDGRSGSGESQSHRSIGPQHAD
ncbi:MAG: hypothetical protein ABEK02_05535 [Haloquadratum sp.]